MELLNCEQIQGKYTNMKHEEIDAVYDVYTLASDSNLTEIAVKDAQKTIKIHGFRTGKVPRSVLEKRLGTHNLYGQYLGAIWDEYCLKNNILVGYKTDLDDIQTRIDGAVVFKVVTMILPKLTLTMREKYQVDITQDVIAQTAKKLQALKSKHTTFKPIKDRQTMWGDTVVIDFEGMLNGEVDGDLTGKGARIEIGAHQIAIPDFEEKIVNIDLNGTKTFEITIPENFAELMPKNPRAPKFAGKIVTFNVTVNEINEKQIPTDEELANKEAKASYAELYGDIAESVFEELENNLDGICSRVSNDVLEDNGEMLTKSIQTPIIENRILSFIEKNQKHFEKMEEEEVKKYLEKNVASLSKGVFHDVVYGCLLTKGDKETTKPTKEEIEAEAEKYAAQYMAYAQGQGQKQSNLEETKKRLLVEEYFMLYRSVQKRKVYTILRNNIEVTLNKEDEAYVAASTLTTPVLETTPSKASIENKIDKQKTEIEKENVAGKGTK